MILNLMIKKYVSNLLIINMIFGCKTYVPWCLFSYVPMCLKISTD